MKLSRFHTLSLAILLCMGVFVFIGSPVAKAVTAPQYTQLENIPGAEGKNKSFPEYVTSIYNLGLWLVGISAMFMLSVGGFMYLTSAGNTSAAGSAKGVIKDALIGLVLGLFAWLILNTINPDLTTLNVSGLQTGTSVTPIPGGQAPSIPSVGASGQYTNSEAVAVLQSAGISVTSSGNCSDQNNANCTSLEGIPKDAINKIIKLKQSCGCSFNVTGGTEVGHASHGPGLPVMDVSQDQTLGNYLNNRSNLSSAGISKICATSTWQRVSYNCGGYVEQKQHFHLAF